MKRIASVFSRDRNERKSEKIQRSTSVTLNVRTLPILSDITTFDSMISTPQLSAGGSEVSSTGGSSLQTPEDVPTVHSTKKTWIPWLTKKSGTIKVSANRPNSTWTPQPAPLLRSPPPGPRAPASSLDPDSDCSSDDGYGDDDLAKSRTAIVTPESLSESRAVLQAFIQNSLNDRPCIAPPFVVSPSAPLYPRSSNLSRSLPRSNSLASTVLKRRMLRRLSDANPQPSEAESIIAFSRRHTQHAPNTLPANFDMIDAKALPTSDHTSSFSIGLRSWTARPCFEDRFSVWTAVDGNITCQRISNSPGFALASLEFSQSIEASADIYGDHPQPASAELRFPPASTSDDGTASSSSSHVSSSASNTRSNPSPQLLGPSPLRNQASTSSSSKSPRKEPSLLVVPPAAEPNKNTSPVSPTSPSDAISTSGGTIKRGVRFIEEEKNENIPLGYVMRVKKQREDKARFLREEKERRQFEEERARIDEERKQRDAERRKWEQERMAWEKEKRAIEEERKRKLFAEEFAASRQRAESSRMGMRVSPSSPSLTKLPRGVEAPPSPRRNASESFVSPAGLRPPSVASGTGFYLPTSRPSSIHSSSEDVRNSRPMSTAFYVPPVPPIPQFYPHPSGFPVDMPLLPPTAPFMVNQYSRRQSQSPQSSSRQRVPSNSSNDSLNRQSAHGPRGSSPASRKASSSSLSASPHRTHQRRTSDDNTRRVSTYSSSPHSSSGHLPRGRSTNPAHSQQMESPWTAPPMSHGGFPSSTGVNTVTRHTPSRRQTTFS